MPYQIEKKLVVGISSNALFDLRTEDEIFKNEGLEAYREYDLDITKAAFMSGGSAVNYIPAFNTSLFLAMHEDDVNEALKAKLPAGRILQTDI